MTWNKHSKYIVHSVQWGINKRSDDMQKGHMVTSVKNILITLSINTSSNLKEKVMRMK